MHILTYHKDNKVKNIHTLCVPTSYYTQAPCLWQYQHVVL